MRNIINSCFMISIRSFLTVVIVLVSLPAFAQWGCGEVGLTASPSASSGCPTAITYTFNPGGMQVISTPSWDISGSGSLSTTQGLSTTVTWTGTSGTRYVRIRYPVNENGNIIERCSEKSYTISAGNPGTISGGPGSLCRGGSGTFTHSGSSGGTLTWQRCTSGCSTTSDAGWSTHTGNTFSSLQTTTSFRVKLTSTCGAVYSNTRTVVVEDLPSAGFMNFIQGSSTLPHTGGGVQFELTGYSSNANLIRWQMQVGSGAWQDLNGGFQSGHHRYPLAGTHSVTQNTSFRAIAKSSSSLGCESESPGIALQTVTISAPPPPPPNPSIQGTALACRNTYYTYSLTDANYNMSLFQTTWTITGSYETNPANTNNQQTIQIRWTSGTTGRVDVQYHNSQYTGTRGFDVTLPSPPVITVSPMSICAGGTVTLSSSGGTFIEYQWANIGTENWTPMTGNSVQLNNALKFRTRSSIPNCGEEFSAPKTVSVETTPTAGSMTFVQGSNLLPHTGGAVQFELTGYSGNANLVDWQQLGTNGTWVSLYGGFQSGLHRSATHFVTANTSFRARVKSSSGLACESDGPGTASQQITINEPPPPPPNPDLLGPTSNVCKEKFHTYTLADADQDITGTFQTSWSITGGSYEVLPSDYQSGAIYHSIQVKWLTGAQGTVTVNYHSAADNVTGVKSLQISLLTPGSLSINASPDGPICSGTNLTLTANGGSSYTWSGPGILNPSANQITISPTVTFTYQLTGIESLCNLLKSATKNVEVLPLPDVPAPGTLTYCDWEQQQLKIDSEFAGTYNWYTANGTSLGKARVLSLERNFNAGSSNYQVEAVSGIGCISPGRATLTVNITSDCDDRLNWIETKSFDRARIISNARQYFDYAGHSLQSQSRTFQNEKIFLSQSIKDRYERVVGSTMAAPSSLANFKFDFKFLWSDNRPYDFRDFDDPDNTSTILNPLPVNDETPGTLGWYFSDNNTWEEHVPTTDFPYSRSDFYEDATGEPRRSAAPGDIHRFGAGHEVLSGTFPVYNELDDYLAKRRNILLLADQLTNITSLAKRGVQYVVKDQNDKYAISITDKSGNMVMSARQGTADDHVLSVPVSITSTVVSSADPNFRPVTYFYLLEDRTVTISPGTNYTIENLITGAPYTPPANNVWQEGFYRIVLTSGTVSLNYTTYFLDVSYQFYDNAGRLKSSLSPNGFKQLKDTPGLSYSTIDQTSYDYNHQGWLLSMKEPDAGVTNYQYRKDGKIRFSQNAEQATTAKKDFSYTLYDKLGRPVESGEYYGTLYSFSSLQSQLEYANQINFATDKRDWIKTYYDVAAPEIPNLPVNEFQQDFVRGAVSWTENENIQTWYSYDELGRLLWMAQRPKVLNKTFVTRYTYDFIGNVLTVFNTMYFNGNSINSFYHHYEYDADNRLSQAFTSTDGSAKKLRATYEYYLHGPLKRIELGEEIQGIDFVYNINGWLTHINHPDKSMDPGGDNNDVFGMLLNYYESELNGLHSSLNPNDLNNPNQWHGLPYSTHRQAPSNEDNGLYKPDLKNFSAENKQYFDMLSNSSTVIK